MFNNVVLCLVFLTGFAEGCSSGSGGSSTGGKRAFGFFKTRSLINLYNLSIGSTNGLRSLFDVNSKKKCQFLLTIKAVPIKKPAVPATKTDEDEEEDVPGTRAISLFLLTRSNGTIITKK